VLSTATSVFTEDVDFCVCESFLFWGAVREIPRAAPQMLRSRIRGEWQRTPLVSVLVRYRALSVSHLRLPLVPGRQYQPWLRIEALELVLGADVERHLPAPMRAATICLITRAHDQQHLRCPECSRFDIRRFACSYALMSMGSRGQSAAVE